MGEVRLVGASQAPATGAVAADPEHHRRGKHLLQPHALAELLEPPLVQSLQVEHGIDHRTQWRIAVDSHVFAVDVPTSPPIGMHPFGLGERQPVVADGPSPAAVGQSVAEEPMRVGVLWLVQHDVEGLQAGEPRQFVLSRPSDDIPAMARIARQAVAQPQELGNPVTHGVQLGDGRERDRNAFAALPQLDNVRPEAGDHTTAQHRAVGLDHLIACILRRNGRGQ